MPPRKPLPAGSNRRFPRADVRVKAKIWSGTDRDRQFEATLQTKNVSVGGLFFESTFFLKIGQVLEVELRLPPQGRLVRARGRVVRVETMDQAEQGFALKFEHYYEQSDVVLANYFLFPVLRTFVQGYGTQRKLRFNNEQLEQFVDMLASWELSRSADPGALWGEP